MKILITGGCGFIGSHVADRFYKEGHEIYIIDNLSTGKMENVNIKHKFYKLSIEDTKCEQVFNANKFDIVVNLATQADVNMSLENPYLDSKTNLLGLTNMLDLASKHGVKKFIFASSAAVYGDNKALPLTEEAEKKPISPYGISKLTGEYYCEKWKEIYGLNTVSFRLSNVYGPRQRVKEDGGVISVFLKKLIDEEDLIVYGDGEQTRDYIYVEDLVDALYKSALDDKFSGVYNLSTNTEKSLNEVIEILNDLHEIKDVVYTEIKKGDIFKSRVDNTKIKKDLHWKTIYSFEEGLNKTYSWYKDNYSSKKNASNDTSKFFKKEKIHTAKLKVMPYFENIIIFIIILLLNLNRIGTTPMNNDLYVYLSTVYIGLMGILYGQGQTIISISLSSLLYFYSYLKGGGDIAVLFYEPKHLIILAIYILVGVITGYSIDKKNRQLYSKELELSSTKEKYEFLFQIYNEIKYTKNELQKQIVNSKDSFGKIYSIVEKLRYLEIEKIFTGSIDVIEEVMDTNKAAIYTINHKGDFLRLKARSGLKEFQISNSIDLNKVDEIREIIHKKELFINRNLISGLPILAAPILENEKVIGIVAVYEIEFENLTLYYENLFKILVSLISDSLYMAYKYEESAGKGKYIEDTKILNKDAFKSILDITKEKYEKFNMGYLLLKIHNEDSYKRVNDKLISTIRVDDYIGIGMDDNIYLIVSNIHMKDRDIIYKRLKEKGITASLLEEEYDV